MNIIDKNRPVSSIKHSDKRVTIPDSAHQGEEHMATSGMPEQSEYDILRNEFQRGRNPSDVRVTLILDRERDWPGIDCGMKLTFPDGRRVASSFILAHRYFGFKGYKYFIVS